MLSHAVYLFAGFLLVGGFALLYSMRNKKLKWGIVLTLVCTVIVYVVITFGPKQSERPFRQPVENIASVSILVGEKYNPKTGENDILLKELPTTDGIELIHALQELEVEYIYFSPFLEPRAPYLEIHYIDGEIEQLSWHNNFWITPDGEIKNGGYRLADNNKLHEILEQYY